MIGALIGLGAKLIGKAVGGSLVDKAGSIVDKVLDQKGKREDANAAVDKASIDQWTAESGKANTNWFDSLVDGFNRLMRPVAFGFTVWVVMIWPQFDLIAFQQAMIAYEAVPEWLVGLVLSVWGFLFTSRFLTKDMAKIKGKSSKEFKEILERMKAVEALRPSQDPESRVIPEVRGLYSEVQPSSLSGADAAPRQSQRAYERDMSDHSKPLSLPAIVEWNRRNGSQ